MNIEKNLTLCCMLPPWLSTHCQYLSSVQEIKQTEVKDRLLIQIKIPTYYIPIDLKFIHSEKATKLCEISTLLLSYVVPVKSKLEISQNFVAFSEYMYILYKMLLFGQVFVINTKWKPIVLCFVKNQNKCVICV